jgi:hypothetical protein
MMKLTMMRHTSGANCTNPNATPAQPDPKVEAARLEESLRQHEETNKRLEERRKLAMLTSASGVSTSKLTSTASPVGEGKVEAAKAEELRRQQEETKKRLEERRRKKSTTGDAL